MENLPELSELLSDEKVISSVQQWLNTFVVDMNLCPFAKAELINQRIRLVRTRVEVEGELLSCLADELEFLNANDLVETTLLIHPEVLQDFYTYNDFLDDANQIIITMGLEGVYQIASFHPQYQFAGTDSDDAENYTNRSPYPMLHILREASLERAIAKHPDVDQIPNKNVALMNSMGRTKLQALFEDLFI